MFGISELCVTNATNDTNYSRLVFLYYRSLPGYHLDLIVCVHAEAAFPLWTNITSVGRGVSGRRERRQ